MADPWTEPTEALGGSLQEPIGSPDYNGSANSSTTSPIYARSFKLAQEHDGLVALQTFEELVYASPGVNSFQKDEIIRIISAHCLSSKMSRDSWYAGLALIGFAQRGEENLTMGHVYSIDGAYPDVDIPEATIKKFTGSNYGSNGSIGSNVGPNVGPNMGADMGPDIRPDTGAHEIPLPWDSNHHNMPEFDVDASSDAASGAAAAGSSQPWQPNPDIETYDPVSNDSVKVTLVPHREGIFMFRHVVYTLEGTFKATAYSEPVVFKVVRRYSDFLWLLECLVKRSPFRLIPNLPPKRLTMDGKYLSADNYFLELRRRGLSRFINQVVKHPVLRKEKFVLMFLTVDTDLSAFRRQAYIEIQDEFVNRLPSPQFIRAWNEKAEMDKWKHIYQAVEDQLGSVTQLCHILDRLSKRQQAMSADHSKISACFNRLSDNLPKVYTDNVFMGLSDVANVPTLSAGLRSAAQYSTNASDLLKDEGFATDVGVLEDLKQYRDFLWSMKEIFVRYGKLCKTSIPQLQQRVTANTQRLAHLQSSVPETKSGDIDRLNKSILKDKNKIQAEKSRSWLIRQCITEELLLCQKNQYQVSKILRDWSLDNTKYSELYSDNWLSFNNVSGDLPLSS